MIVASSRAYARRIESAADQLNASLPEVFTAALATAQSLNDAVPAFDAAVSKLNSRAVELLLDGRDPSADKEVQRLAVARVIADAGLRQAAGDRANSIIGQAIAENADTILGQWISAVHSDCTVLADSAAQLSDIPDLRRADITNLKNSRRLEIWSNAMSAFERVEVVAAGQKAFLTALNVRHQREHWVLAYCDDLTVIEAVNAVTGSTAPDAWTVASVGAPLSLCNVSTFVERIRDYNAEMERRRIAEELARTPVGFDGERRREVTI